MHRLRKTVLETTALLFLQPLWTWHWRYLQVLMYAASSVAAPPPFMVMVILSCKIPPLPDIDLSYFCAPDMYLRFCLTCTHLAPHPFLFNHSNPPPQPPPNAHKGTGYIKSTVALHLWNHILRVFWGSNIRTEYPAGCDISQRDHLSLPWFSLLFLGLPP